MHNLMLPVGLYALVGAQKTIASEGIRGQNRLLGWFQAVDMHSFLEWARE